MDAAHKIVLDEELVEAIEHSIDADFPLVNVNTHAVACTAAAAAQAHRLAHINDSPGMGWVEDTEDDDEPPGG